MAEMVRKMKRFLTDAIALVIMALYWLALISAASIPISLLFILKNSLGY
jgi:hypothetical protein